MDEMLHSFAFRFGLTEDEKHEVVVSADGDCRISQYPLVGKLLAHKNYNKEVFMSFFRNLWRSRVEVTIQALSGDRFLFAFSSDEDHQTVLHRGPWTFKKMLLLLSLVHDYDIPQHIPLRRQAFWIQAFGIPLVFMTMEMGKVIGQSLGSLVNVDQNRNSDCLGEFFRIKVEIDVFQALQ